MKKVIVNNQHERYLFLADEVVFQVLHPAITAENEADLRGRILGAIDRFLRPTPPLAADNWRYRLDPPNADTLRIVSFQPPVEPPTDTEPPTEPPNEPPDEPPNEPPTESPDEPPTDVESPPLTLSFTLSQLPAQEPKPFSLIPIKVFRSEPESPTPSTPADVLTLLNDIYTELRGQFIITGGGGDDNDKKGKDDDEEKEKDADDQEAKDPAKIGKEGDEEEKDPDKKEKDDDGGNRGDKGNGFKTIILGDEGDEIELKSISPNWLASDLHHSGNTGGPGSIPVSKPAPPHINPEFRLEGPIDSLTDYRRPGAQIAILDTAIPFEENGAANFHPDLKSLLDGDSGLEIILYKNVVPPPYGDDLDLFDPYADWEHHYEMRDHGTFIASIIRRIAPNAKIYLYEVLNKFGVGSLISIAQGVVNAVNHRGNNTVPALVLNCSFTLEDDVEDFDLKKNWPKLTELFNWDIQELLKISTREVFNWATSRPNVIVVAAAGNDGKDAAGNRYPTRNPASFEGILSVAALPKEYPTNSNGRYKPAKFSNRAHSDGSNKQAYSFATFGGDLVNPDLAAPLGGVLGVYVKGIPTQNPTDGTFIEGPNNTTGWAEWSGTSFSTPIIAGLLAAQPGDPIMTASPAGASSALTPAGENVIIVRQD